MITQKENNRISKFLSLVLRHKPETIGIELDSNGWVDVTDLIDRSNEYGISYDIEILKHVVSTNDKKRFAFNSEYNKIRASQGHSIDIKLGYSSKKPPEILYHGTAQTAIDSILKNGIQKRNRQHVHLSSDVDTAIKVGQRHGKPIVFEILAFKMFEDKFEFFISDNGVWLTDNVPAKYLIKAEE